MWERKTEKAKWNGNVLHIQSTTLDGGKRLHVAEMPYLDAPHIKVMGAKSRTISIEVVFVGVNSLADANAVIAELEDNPDGQLEHPYLGELSLVFETYSQTFSTKKGLVTLSLKFYRQGAAVELMQLEDKSVSELVTAVVDASNTQFVEEVGQASSQQINAMKTDLTSALNALRKMANRSTQSSLTLARLHRQIEDGFTAVEMIKNAPEAYSVHFNAIVNSLQKVLTEDESSTNGDTTNEGTRATTNVLIQSINPDAKFSHCNMHITAATLQLSDALNTLTHVEHVDIFTFNKQSLDTMEQNISVIQRLLIARIDDVSKEATVERLALVDAVQALHEHVNAQANKLTQFKQSLSRVETVSARPLLCIAQSNECNASDLTRLNRVKHPLFVTGTLQVPHV